MTHRSTTNAKWIVGGARRLGWAALLLASCGGEVRPPADEFVEGSGGNAVAGQSGGTPSQGGTPTQGGTTQGGTTQGGTTGTGARPTIGSGATMGMGATIGSGAAMGMGAAMGTGAAMGMGGSLGTGADAGSGGMNLGGLGGTCTGCSAVILEGDLVAETQDELNAHAGTTHVTGSIILHGDITLTSLEPLSHLESIGGDLVLEWMYNLADVDELANLRTIGGTLSITHSNIASVDLSGLASVESIGGDFEVTDCEGAQLLEWIGEENIAGQVIAAADGC